MTRRLDDTCSDLRNQLQNKAKEFESFGLAMDKSNDTGDIAQLLIVIRGFQS
jgi:hypothetical protein